MKKLWYSKLFWFIIISLVLYWYFAPIVEMIIHFSSKHGLRLWSPVMLIIALASALIPFVSIYFFPTGKLTKFIIKTKKVFKIIFISLVPFLIIFYSFWYIPKSMFNASPSFKTAYSYIKQDTTITNKIGSINDYYKFNSQIEFSGKAKYEIRLFGQKGNAVADIQLTRKDKWTVDTVIYKLE